MSAVPQVSVFVALPCYGGIEPLFVQSLLDLQAHMLRLGTPHHFEWLPGESLITRARNRLVRRFLDRQRESHLLFLDCDLVFRPTQILRLLGSGHEVAAVPYAKKRQGAGLVGNVASVPGSEKKREDGETVGLVQPHPDSEGWVKAHDVGTGCLMIARTAFEKLASAKRPDGEPAMVPYTCDLEEGSPKTYPFFDCGPENGRDPSARYLSEDFWFARLWQTVGRGDIWLDAKTSIQHVGKFGYHAPSFERQWAEAK